jgi:hypothetical protein
LNFQEDLRQQFADWLSVNGYPSDGDLHAVVVRYLNVTKRMPQVRRWQIRKSREVRRTRINWRIRLGLWKFIWKARKGENLNPYLSTGILDADFRDLMFYDWGIHHFHLGTHLDDRGFVERTDELLFAIADGERGIMYLVDIHPHDGGFTNQDLLRIIEENWPELLDKQALRGITPSYEGLSDDEVKKLRQGGINVAYGTPGGRTVAMMGGGITTAKTNMQDVKAADSILLRVRQAEAGFRTGLTPILTYFQRVYGLSKDDLSFHAQLGAKNVIWVCETRTETPVWNERESWLIAVIELNR